MLHGLTDRSTDRPAGRHSRHQTPARPQTENQGNAVGVGPATGGDVVRCAPIEQSFYLTEDNSTNWFLLAGDAASFGGDAVQHSNERTREWWRRGEEG